MVRAGGMRRLSGIAGGKQAGERGWVAFAKP